MRTYTIEIRANQPSFEGAHWPAFEESNRPHLGEMVEALDGRRLKVVEVVHFFRTEPESVCHVTELILSSK